MDAEEREFGEFVAVAGPGLLKTARLLTGDWYTGEDLVQTTLAKVYLRWDRFPDWESPQAYARKVMVNTYCTWHRRRWRGELAHPDPAAVEPVGDVADAVVAADALRRALAGLSRRERAVIVLRYFEDLPVAQIADLLGCPPGTVSSLVSRGLAQLRLDASRWRSAEVEEW